MAWIRGGNEQENLSLLLWKQEEQTISQAGDSFAGLE